MAKELLKGNVAVAEAGLRGRLRASSPVIPLRRLRKLWNIVHRMPELGMEDPLCTV